MTELSAPLVPAAGKHAADRPGTITTAFWLYVSTAVLGVVGAVIGTFEAMALLDDSAYMQEILDAGGGVLTEEAARISMLVGFGIGLVVSIVIAGLYVLFPVFLLRGANWARIVLTVLSGITLAAGAFNLVANALLTAVPELNTSTVDVPVQPYSYVLYAAQLLVAAVAIVLMWLPPSNGWFRRVRADKAQAW